MNHAHQYANLINKALDRQSSTVLYGYYEQHHILPRSCGGQDNPGNLVLLTVKEHYIAHLLLSHMPGGETQWGSVDAILRDAINIKSPRFLQVRYMKWTRKRIAYARAKWVREAAKAKALQNYKRAILIADNKYANSFVDIAFDEYAIL